MLEKDMEELIKLYPYEFFEQELELVGNQVRVSNGIVDVVFKTKHGHILFIEIKSGSIKMKDMEQIIDYKGPVKDEFPGRHVFLMLVANNIGEDYKAYLDEQGVECLTIPVSKFKEVGIKHGYSFSQHQKREVSSAKSLQSDVQYIETSEKNLRELISDVCRLQTLRTAVITSNSPTAKQIFSLLEKIKIILQKYLREQGIQDFRIQVSQGQGNFPKTPWIDILPHNQKPTDGIFVGIIFDKKGKGVVVGCMHSLENPRNITTQRCRLLDVNNYRNAFINPNEISLLSFEEVEFKKQIISSWEVTNKHL